MFQASEQIKLFVIDPKELSRVGSCLFFENQGSITVVGAASNIEEALPELEKQQPDVIFLSADGNGATLGASIRRVQRLCSKARWLARLELLDEAALVSLIGDNVSGICSARVSLDALVAGLHATATGCSWYDMPVAEIVHKYVLSRGSRSQREDVPRYPRNDLPALTKREDEILNYIARGFSNRKIAEELNLSVETVKTHIRRIMDKSAARSREELVDTRAVRERLL